VKLIQLFVWICISTILCGQSRNGFSETQSVRKGLIYKSEWSLDLALHTNGYYIGYNKGKVKSYHTTTYTHFDLGLVFHPDETRSSSAISTSFKSFSAYKFGKQNQLINIRIGKGIIRTFSEKARNRGIAMGLKLEAGFDLGLLKPYYLEISERLDGREYIREKKYTPEDENFLTPENIRGSANFFRGFDELSIVPGVFGRVALRFDPGAFEKTIFCWEAGIQIDLYSKRPAIMVIEKNPYSFLNLYLNLQFGSRKN
jgi:hypothetical protein